jgi:hypothetical protein
VCSTPACWGPALMTITLALGARPRAQQAMPVLQLHAIGCVVTFVACDQTLLQHIDCEVGAESEHVRTDN